MYAPLNHLKPWRVGAQLFEPSDPAGPVAQSVGFSGSVQLDLAENASWIAYWGARVAEAKSFHDEEQEKYRVARSTWKSTQPKMTKEAIDEAWRASKEYPAWYERLRVAEYAWNTTQYIYESVTKKSFNLGAMTKTQQDELGAIHRAHGAQQPPR